MKIVPIRQLEKAKQSKEVK